ncbi:MAG: MFS transporter [Acidimicrobiia bacterium]
MPPTPDQSRRSWRFGFTAILVLAMVAATQMPAGLGILAPFMRDDLGVSRTQIGILITTAVLVAAVISPLMGRVVDSLGGRRGIVLLFISAGLGLLGLAMTSSYWWMLVPVAIAALAQAFGNPVTNKLIAAHTSPGRRGIVTGIKQSGVQVGIFVAGLTMPVVAAAWGWRWAIGLTVVVPLVGLLMALALLPGDERTVVEDQPDARSEAGRLPEAITFLAAYGALMGFGAAHTVLIPLFAVEALGMSEQAGGAAAGLIGFVSLFARIGWSRYADAHSRHDLTLAVLAVGSVGAVLVFMVAQEGAPWLLWIGAIATGVTSSSWNSVGMLAVIDHAGEEQSGRASGIVMFGFLAGWGVAPTLFGWLVDRTDSYTPMWLISVGALGMAAVLAVWWVRRAR